jgi:D-glycero-alpha-D-manno-heptose-7-phosphate kinase
MIINKTPFRISFFGGGTDFPEFFNNQPTTIISSSINKFCYTSLKKQLIVDESKYKLSYSMIDKVDNIKDIEHPVIRACLKYFDVNDPLEIHYDADLPGKSGIGSSSSFTVGLLHTLNQFYKKSVSKNQLAETAIHIEREVLRENVGFQDQYAAAFGGFNKIIFSKSGVKVEKLSSKMKSLINDYLVMFYYPKPRFSSDIQSTHIKKIEDNHDKLLQMNEISLNALDAVNNLDIITFSKLLDKSWNIKKSLNDNISSSEINNIYKKAKNNGALGGKISGAGGGGFLYFLCPPEYQKKMIQSVTEVQYINSKLNNKGSEIIYER